MIVKAHHIRSAVIGYWRCGADVKDIARIMFLSIETINQIISEYEKVNGNYCDVPCPDLPGAETTDQGMVPV